MLIFTIYTLRLKNCLLLTFVTHLQSSHSTSRSKVAAKCAEAIRHCVLAGQKTYMQLQQLVVMHIVDDHDTSHTTMKKKNKTSPTNQQKK